MVNITYEHFISPINILLLPPALKITCLDVYMGKGPSWVLVYVHTHTHTHTHTNTHKQTHANTHTRTHTHTHKKTDTHTDTHRHTDTDTHTHTHTHTNTHKQTHAYTNTPREFGNTGESGDELMASFFLPAIGQKQWQLWLYRMAIVVSMGTCPFVCVTTILQVCRALGLDNDHSGSSCTALVA